MVNIVLNGDNTDVNEDASLPLILALRNHLNLQSARFGCGNEDCGACTVLLNDEPCFSCTVSLDAVDKQRVDTVEGLTDQVAEILRSAFIAERAGQCGYCLSGMFVTAYSIVSARQPVTRAEIKAKMSRHLCRCGAYPSILRAVEGALQQVLESADA